MEEESFTSEEIEQIIDEAKDPIYSEPNMAHPGFYKTAVIGVSRANGLILANGNEWTGYVHIIERHNIISRKPYWNNNKLDNPTKFRPNLAPVEYLTVASKIYHPSNLDNSKNKFPEKYEAYTGSYIHYDGIELIYRLLVYKGTKIIHTFYLCDNKKPFNKKKILDLRQGGVSATHDDMRDFQTFKFSYYNSKDIEVFKIIINVKRMTEQWFIQVNSSDGNPFLTTFIREVKLHNKIHFMFRISEIEYENPNWYEKIMNQILEDKYIF